MLESMKAELNTLKQELVTMKENKQALEDKLSTMSSDPLAHFEDAIESAWDDCLNEMYGEQVDALPFYCGSAAELCQDKDPTFYRCGLNDFADSYDVTNEDDYRELSEQIEEMESSIFDLESEMEDLELEIEELEIEELENVE